MQQHTCKRCGKQVDVAVTVSTLDEKRPLQATYCLNCVPSIPVLTRAYRAGRIHEELDPCENTATTADRKTPNSQSASNSNRKYGLKFSSASTADSVDPKSASTSKSKAKKRPKTKRQTEDTHDEVDEP